MELEDSDNADSTPPLSGELPSLSLFIENMGLHYQEYGVPRIGGRILGLLFIHPSPSLPKRSPEALQVSPQQQFDQLRTLLLTDLVEKSPGRGALSRLLVGGALHSGAERHWRCAWGRPHLRLRHRHAGFAGLGEHHGSPRRKR